MTSGLLAPRPPFCRAQNLVGWPALPLRAAWLGGTVVFGASTVLLMKSGAASQAFTVLLGHSAPQEPL